jgi:hypothetical protein
LLLPGREILSILYYWPLRAIRTVCQHAVRHAVPIEFPRNTFKNMTLISLIVVRVGGKGISESALSGNEAYRVNLFNEV